MKRIFSIITASSLFLIACEKDVSSQYNPSASADLSVEFDHIAGGQNVLLGSTSYTNAAGESFTIDVLKYFVSNIKLTKTDGSEYVVPQDSSYFLVDESVSGANKIKLKVPEGEYKNISFVLGVDSLRNTMDISQRTGVLDPAGTAAGMYWSWNSGYIFFKMEGTSPQAPVDGTGNRKYRYHIGGFGGYSTPMFNNIKTITIDLTASGIAKIKTGRTPNIHLMVDVLKVLNGTTNVSIAANPTVMVSPYSVNIANNYVSMFSHDHTEN